MISGDGEGLVDVVRRRPARRRRRRSQYSASYPTPAALRARGRARRRARRDRREPRPRAHLELGARQRRLHRAGGGEAARRRPERRAPPAVPRRAGRRARRPRSSAGSRRSRPRAYGNTITYTPEDRAARALDGDTDDRVARRRARQRDRPVHPPPARRADHDRSREPRAAAQRRPQPLDHEGRARSSTASTKRVGRARRVVAHGRPARRSRSAPRRFSTLEIKITGVSDPPAASCSAAPTRVGFAEIRLRDAHADHDVRVDEVVQMPQDLLDALGARVGRAPARPRDDPRRAPPGAAAHRSRAVDRRARSTCPAPRTFALTGQREREPRRDRRRDRRRARPCRRRVTADASESLAGCLQCHAASAADGDPTTAWNTPFVGVGGQWVQFDAPQPITFSHMNLQVVADGRHSVPTSIELQVDGAVRELDAPADRRPRRGERDGRRCRCTSRR